jgi:glycosyltransferase involved in cell wall biosynthesis
MRIGIDGGCWNNRRGYGRYLRELLEAVARIDGSHKYTVFLDSSPSFPLPALFEPILVGTSQTVAESARADGRRSIGDLMRMSRAVARHKLDLLFFPSVYSYFPVLRPVPMVLGIHDTIADRNPQLAFASKRQELFWWLKVRLGILQADKILTVSHYSKRCVEQCLRVPSSQIRVVYEAASPVFRKLSGPGGTGDYLLYVGGISPNKNLAMLVRAFARLKRRDGLKLLLVGDFKNDGFKGCYMELTALVQELGLDSEVLFPGYVPDEELCRLYNQARAFVLPSLDEGFGLPVLEAMACGSPVVIGTGNAMEEVAGDAAILVDARDEVALSGALDRVLSDAPYRAELAQKSLRRATEFSWDAAARSLLRLFEETGSESE